MAERLPFRTGIGYDSHRFAPGGPLVLGGVDIPADVHLRGHSDGDAIAHALTDAVLGSAGLCDIGAMFPDSDPGNAGRDSIEMLILAVGHVEAAGWRVGQLDVVVITETPRILPYRQAMRERIAGADDVAHPRREEGPERTALTARRQPASQRDDRVRRHRRKDVLHRRERRHQQIEDAQRKVREPAEEARGHATLDTASPWRDRRALRLVR